MKSGIDYFPLDCQLDEKFDLIEAEFGLTGFSVVVKLLQRIYGGQGYYCEWTNEVALLFAKRIGLGGNVVSEIVSASLNRGIFDKNIYEKYSVLTSRGIQERYFEAVSRRKSVNVKSAYLLLCNTQIPKNVDISSENVYINQENEYNSKQSKVEESRVKESRVEESKSGVAAAHVLTPDEKSMLISEFGASNVEAYIKKMERWKQKKNITTTIDELSWLSKCLKQDNLSSKSDTASFDVNELENRALEKYRK